MLRFDNEAGKGDHWHRRATQQPWDLTTLPTLLTNFWRAIHDGKEPRKARHSRAGSNPGY